MILNSYYSLEKHHDVIVAIYLKRYLGFSDPFWKTGERVTWECFGFASE